MQVADKVWHRWLRRPYRLRKTLDSGERNATPIVLLHGLASSSKVWRPLAGLLAKEPYRIVSFDLLGHGGSPKPDWLRYDVDDHVRMVIAALERCRFGQPVLLVGHSMGCLIGVRLARLRPDLVCRLVLYEMPLYAGLPDKRRYRLRLNVYFKLYERVIAYRPIFSGPGVGKAQRLAERYANLTFTPNTWKPFVQSLKHTIMEQTTDQDIQHVKVPMDVIYGTRDRVVIRGKTTALFGKDATHITAHTVRASHNVTAKASYFLAARIKVAVGQVLLEQAPVSAEVE